MHRFLATILLVLTLTPLSVAQTISDYLILQDIGPYKLDRPEKMLPGRPPIGGPEVYNNSAGIVGPADHFSLDHTDTTYKVMYFGGNGIPSPSVFVTKHAGSESDKWLLHEVEDGFIDNLGATYISPNPLRDINGYKIFYTWGYYDWVSNNVVVSIKFTDMTGTKAEPLEVVQAYLQKIPSTIPSTLVLNNTHKTTWIKDEMDRRLWLCDKWFYQLQLQKVQQADALQVAVESMNIFLDYREKYCGIKAADEKNLLASYLNASNSTGIKAKLIEYKTWWVANKGNAIML